MSDNKGFDSDGGTQIVIALSVLPELDMPDTPLFTTTGDSLKAIAGLCSAACIDEFAMEVSAVRLNIRAHDAARIMLTEINIPIAGGPAEPHTVHLDQAKITDCTKAFANGESVEVATNGDKLVFKVGRKRRSTGMIHPLGAKSPILPSIPYSVIATVPADWIGDCIKSAKTVKCDTLTLRHRDGHVSWLLAGDVDSFENSTPAEATESCEATYGRDLMEGMADCVGGDTATLSFGKDMPCRLDFQLPGGGTASCMLAPKF